MNSLLRRPLILFTLPLLQALPTSLAQSDNDIPYSACPPIRAYYPPPTILKSSETFASLVDDFTSVFDNLIRDRGSEDFGDISANTTSFSVVLFDGADSLGDDPVFFEYHYTAPQDVSDARGNVTSDTKFPIGDLTMVLTVYAWLAQMGEQWDAPITKFLPELEGNADAFSVQWEDVNVGALAGQLSGIARESFACMVGAACNWPSFVESFAQEPPVFLPDTTPMVSYAAFQLLAFAMQRNSTGECNMGDFSEVLELSLFGPLNMTGSGLLSQSSTDVFAIDGFNMSQYGEPAALSLVATVEDLAKLGHAILSSKLISPAATRRWLHPNTDTSNLRNGVGRPWEVYRAGESTISPVLDVLTKSGTIGKYASYFGIAPDFNAGFAIVAHDASVADRKLDLNVYADIVSGALIVLQEVAAKEMAMRYAGEFTGGDGDDSSIAVLNVTDNGPGLAVQRLEVGGVDLRAEVAKKLGIKTADLDFRLYPTNVQDSERHQFVAIFQDESAPVDMGTPTCITWQEVGAVSGIEYRFIFDLNEGGAATRLVVPGTNIDLTRGQ